MDGYLTCTELIRRMYSIPYVMKKEKTRIDSVDRGRRDHDLNEHFQHPVSALKAQHPAQNMVSLNGSTWIFLSPALFLATSELLLLLSSQRFLDLSSTFCDQFLSCQPITFSSCSMCLRRWSVWVRTEPRKQSSTSCKQLGLNTEDDGRSGKPTREQ